MGEPEHQSSNKRLGWASIRKWKKKKIGKCVNSKSQFQFIHHYLQQDLLLQAVITRRCGWTGHIVHNCHFAFVPPGQLTLISRA
jgi:hypothetical protein